MRKVYLDRTELTGAINVNLKDTGVEPAGTTIYPMSVYHKNEEYNKYADDYDIQFIFEMILIEQTGQFTSRRIY